MQEGLKKIDIGEFNGFLRDFQINLPRVKTNDVFLKAGQNLKLIEYDHFKRAIVLAGKEYIIAKCRENQERAKELEKIVKDLKIPKEFENAIETIEFQSQLEHLLHVKTSKYVKYVDNNLRQKNFMVD